MEHSFNVQIAQKYGVDAAIVINNLIFWIVKNRANGKHLHIDPAGPDEEKKTWTYNTRLAFEKLFPYWSAKQIRRIFTKLVYDKDENKDGILLTGNFNNTRYDRTLWYAFRDEKVFLPPQNSICPNGQIDLPKQTKQCAQMGKPIPNPKSTDNKPDCKQKQTVLSQDEILALDFQIGEENKKFTRELSQILHPRGNEVTTFANISRHLVRKCQASELSVSIFNDAIEWAKEAQCSNANNPKGLFVSKIKQATGFRAATNLLSKQLQPVA